MSEREELWKRAASRAASDRFFLASSLAQYQTTHGMSDAQLALALGCTVEDLRRLGLCRCPDTRSTGFSNEVGQIAARFQIKPDALAGIIRFASFAQALQTTTRLTAAQTAMPVTFAAQDREDEDEDDEDHEA
jgi:hypothetical protein